VQAGDLVSMDNACGGFAGGIKCKSALVLDTWLSHHEQVQVDSQTYHDREVYECSLVCKCGTFEEYADNLEVISEGR
jgi:hypothetical protein